MIRFYVLLFLFFSVHQGRAQSLESIKQHLLNNELIEAKTEVEIFLAIPENEQNPYAWYFKGFVYNLLSKDSQFTIPLTNPKSIAFNAFTKCLEIAPKHKWLENDHYAPLFDIYNSFFENGKNVYAQGNYELALDHFINAEKVQQYLFKNNIHYKKFSFTGLDTSLIFNIATTALKAEKEKDGIFYFVRIAEAKLNDPIYLPVYHALVKYFASINDEIGFRKYLRIGQQLFPYDNYWIQAEMDMVKSAKLTDALMQSHDEKIKKDPNNFKLSYELSSDLLNVLYYTETKPRHFDELRAKLEKTLHVCLSLQQKGTNTEFLFAQYYLKDAQYRGAKRNLSEDDLKQQKEIFEKAIPYAETVLNEYNQKQKMNRVELEVYKMIATMLIDIYTGLNNETQLKLYKDKLKQIESILPVYVPKKK
jgi:hypothetical protein